MRHYLAILCLCSATAVASGIDPQAPTSKEVLTALSKRTGISETELHVRLSHCDADQQSMNLCAYRDFEAVDLALKRVVADKETLLPMCKSIIDAKVTRWKKARDQGCEKSAEREYGGGSIKPTVQAICAAAETAKIGSRVKAIKQCTK